MIAMFDRPIGDLMNPMNSWTGALAWWTAAQRASTQWWEIAFTSPQVISHRVSRMATAGMFPDQRDRKEFARMGLEKVDAFGEAWFAVAMDLWLSNLGWANTLAKQYWGGAAPTMMSWRWPTATTRMAGKALHPVRRRVRANVKRLRLVKR
jgi:hypothetical protein